MVTKCGGMVDVWTDEATTAQAIVDMEVAEFEKNDQGWTAADFHIHNCAK